MIAQADYAAHVSDGHSAQYTVVDNEMHDAAGGGNHPPSPALNGERAILRGERLGVARAVPSGPSPPTGERE
jgi:hypothetical protein